MSTIPNGTANVRRRRVFGLVPLLLFVGLVLLFLIRLIAGDPSRIPSALIGQPAHCRVGTTGKDHRFTLNRHQHLEPAHDQPDRVLIRVRIHGGKLT